MIICISNEYKHSVFAVIAIINKVCRILESKAGIVFRNIWTSQNCCVVLPVGVGVAVEEEGWEEVVEGGAASNSVLIQT